jgi:mono/diheme cytochrome c family protein
MPGRPDEAERYRRPSEIMDFTTLYATQCSGCHGAEGRLGPARPLADPLYLALVKPAQLTSIVAGGVPGTSMPPFAKRRGGALDDEQIAVLVDGMLAIWADPTSFAASSLPPYSAADARAAGAPAGDATRGARAFGEFCASCHGVDGRGGRDGSVVDPSLLELVSDQMLRTSIIAGRPDLGMPDWRTLSPKRAMTPREISDVVAWLAARRPRDSGTEVASATQDRGRDAARGGADGARP